MVKQMKQNLLTIVISTYNRADLMEKNICKMLKYDLDVSFIIGDNASTDDTWDRLIKLTDPRVKIQKNDRNLGIENACLLASLVQTQYFLFLNDRDYIEEKDLERVLCFLSDHYECQMIASFGGGLFRKEGYYYEDDFFDYYYFANHPGYLIYRTDYFKEHIDNKVLSTLIDNKESEIINNYIEFNLLMNIKIGYFRSHDYIVQPQNRDLLIKQTRKEIFGKAYVLPEFHIDYFYSKLEYGLKKSYSKDKMKSLLLALYRNSLYKTEVEFHRSVQSEAFRIRNSCEDADPKDWLKNGISYTKALLQNELLDEYELKRAIVRLFFKQTLLNVPRIIRDDMGERRIQ